MREGTCGRREPIITAAGIIMLTCTLPVHDGKIHYDDAFCIEWGES